MNNSSFKLTIVTPTMSIEKDITSIRLKDETGFFGILKGHSNFITVLVPSLCYYKDEQGKEVFLAVDEGIASVRDGTVTITSKEVFESDNAEKLSEVIETTQKKRNESEASFRGMIVGIEKSFMEKTVKLMREGR